MFIVLTTACVIIHPDTSSIRSAVGNEAETALDVGFQFSCTPTLARMTVIYRNDPAHGYWLLRCGIDSERQMLEAYSSVLTNILRGPTEESGIA